MSDPEFAPPLTAPHHRIRLRDKVEMLSFNFAAELHAPWTVLFGPSGSGKSTLLRALCGLLPIASKARSLTKLQFIRRNTPGGWTVLADEGLFMPVHRRSIAYAPQAPSLFSHLSVGENVRFGASSQGSTSFLTEEACDLFELAPLWSRLPTQLSGGEQQRVNLARAFARPDSRLMLLDEPFNGMDRSLRDRLLKRLRPALAARELPVLSVTHDVEEAFLLQADVLRLEAGRLAEQGPAARVLAAEARYIRAAFDEPAR